MKRGCGRVLFGIVAIIAGLIVLAIVLPSNPSPNPSAIPPLATDTPTVVRPFAQSIPQPAPIILPTVTPEPPTPTPEPPTPLPPTPTPESPTPTPEPPTPTPEPPTPTPLPPTPIPQPPIEQRAAPALILIPSADQSACDCNNGNTLNCDSFDNSFDAQACYLRCRQLTGEDIHGLDRDDDGAACEWRN